MPCLNEAETVGTCIKKAKSFLEREGILGEVIVADNGSTDGSQELAKEHGARVVSVSSRGYGAALSGGIAAARGQYVIMGDSDGTYDFSRLDAFVKRLREGYDLVMGNRFKGGIQPRAMPFLHRYLGNPVLSFIGRLFFHGRMGDFYCGLRGFRREIAERMNLRSTDMEFALEMVVKASMLGMRITEVPTTLSISGRRRAPHLRTWKHGWASLRFFLLYNPRWLFFYPGTLVMSVSGLLGLLILISPRALGAIILDVHTLLYCAVGVALGYQGIIFSVFSKIIAMRMGLHPPKARSRSFARILGAFTVERGLIGGGLLALIGLAMTAYALYIWYRTGFGDLDPFLEMRIVIPAALLLMVGVQTVLASMHMGLLQMLARDGAQDFRWHALMLTVIPQSLLMAPSLVNHRYASRPKP